MNAQRLRIATALPLIMAVALCAAEDAHDHCEHEHHDHEQHEPEPADSEPAVILDDDAMKRHGVTVAVASESKAISRPIIAPAWVVYDSDKVAQVGSVVHGRIAKLHVGQGSVVKAGDPLLAVDSPELGRAQSGFLQKRAAVEVARSNLGVSDQSYQRAQTLAAENAMPAAEVQRREADLARARTEVMAADADFQAAMNELTLLGLDKAACDELSRTGTVSPRLTIRAPLDGTVIARTVNLGQVVGPDTESLLTLADPQSLWVLANVPESQAAQIATGTQAIITGPLLGNTQLKTKVLVVSPSVDASTRSVQVRLSVDGTTGLRPGAFVQVELRPESSHSSVVVPRNAVFAMNGGSVVFVCDDAPNRFIAREVEVLPPNGESVAVVAGLKAGESVVVTGGFIIKADLGKAGAKGCCDND